MNQDVVCVLLIFGGLALLVVVNYGFTKYGHKVIERQHEGKRYQMLRECDLD